MAVPPAPENYNDQSFFYFNAVPSGTGIGILQPVLQYDVGEEGDDGPFGGECWGISTWYVVADFAYVTDFVEVVPGAILQGSISLTPIQPGPMYTYSAQFLGHGATKALRDTLLPETMIALESYGVTASNINVATTVGVPDGEWDPVIDNTDGIDLLINVDGAVNAQITITSPPQ